jgi:hypothetical protein
MSLSYKLWWNQLIPHLYFNYYLTKNEMVMVIINLFYFTNQIKKMGNEEKNGAPRFSNQTHS